MLLSLLKLLRCPITREALTLQVITTSNKLFDNEEKEIVETGILFSPTGWFYPIIGGIPRLLVEAFIDYEDFLQTHLADYQNRKTKLYAEYKGVIKYSGKKNKHTKKSFEQEWSLYNYESDKTWDADPEEMYSRFLKEVDEQMDSLKDQLIFDAGCGNGLLDILMGQHGATVLAMDFSKSIEKAFKKNTSSKVFFVQGDIQFPPVPFNEFDLLHCSGVLVHTNNPELSFATLAATVKKGGKLSVWLYHSRQNLPHNIFNALRQVTSKLPLRFQYYLYGLTLFPVSFIIKRIKGNKQNSREMMIDILDWFSPEFRWEVTHEEVKSWFFKYGFHEIQITTASLFGFNTIGTKLLKD